MSINHFSTDLQETPWWEQHPQQLQQSMMETTQNSSNNSSSSATDPQQQQQFSSWSSPHHHQFYHHHQQHQHHLWLDSYNNNNNNNSHHNPTLSFNLNSQHDATEAHPMKNLNSNQEQELEKEPMFEKPLTPSDVGKLNRLVIPKQHAEKYFPLGGGGGGADLGSSSSDKGLLLSFEDESGKCWRFRYSYWNSSQSYVLTKGWSRYVKEKRLDAGDVILFERHRTDSERLFIGWRRRGATAVAQVAQAGGGCGWPRGLYPNHPYPVDHVAHGHGVSVPLYQHAGSGVQSQTTSVGNSRTLRLFGVNFECQVDDKSEGSESQAEAHGHQQFNYSVEAYDSNSTNRHNHVDITFSQEDVNQMRRNRQG